MKTWLMILFLTLLPFQVLSAESPSTGHEGSHFSADRKDVDTPPEQDKGIPRYAVERRAGEQEGFGGQPVHDNEIFAVFRADRLEFQTREGKDAFLWDVEAWVGADYNKFYLESEGTWLFHEEEFEEAEVEVLYGRNMATFWDLKVGLRHDFEPEPSRTFGALGFQGLAPYWFEVEATAYISEDGDLSAGLEAEYDFLLSQRLILQPRFHTAIALQEVEEYGTGQGINDIQLGLRLRYEIKRKFAPYAGVSWSRKLGETADLARDEGEDIDTFSFVVGLKAWF